MSDELCLAVDLGTGGPKVGLVTHDGVVVAHERHEVTTTYGADGAATQDAAQWWEIVKDATRRLLARPEAAGARVRSVAVTGQYASTVPVDAEGVPTGPCLTWLDTRGAHHVRRAIGGPALGYHPVKVLRFVRRSGGAPSTAGDDPVGHMLYLGATDPGLVERTRWFMEPVDYLTMRFSGVAAATHASRLAAWLTDNRDLSAYAYDARLLATVGLDDRRLPPLVPFGSAFATLAPGVADELGLARDTVVVTGVPDLHAGALGSGAVALYETHLALSTTSWISCPVPAKKTDAVHAIAAVPGLTNGSYLVIDNQQTGARALQWLRDALATRANPLDYDDLTALAATSAPGAGGVTFTPWLAGERSPVEDKRVRAGFASLSVTTTTADLARAVLEGVAANSAWLMPYVEKFVGRPLSPVRILGGGALSTLWCQVYADTLNRPVEQVPDPLVAQLRGVALLAAAAVEGASVAEVARRVARGRTFVPAAPAADLYAQRQSRWADRFGSERRWARGG